MKTNTYFSEDLLELFGIEEKRSAEWDKYINSEVGAVPRVTKIISQCRDSEGLIEWAANLGRRKYDYYRGKSLETGTIVHKLIDEYLICKYKTNTQFNVNYEEIPQDLREGVYNAITNFKVWENNLNLNGGIIEEVVGLEIPVDSPWYGGTIDAIMKINGLYYIIDFKTSKVISNEYLIQTAAYMWMINQGYAPNLPHISGIGIIRVDKKKLNNFTELFINEFHYDGAVFIDNLYKCFASYLEAYYRTINIDALSARYIKAEYNPQYIKEGYHEQK